MDFHGVLQGIVLYIGLPLAALIGFAAGRTGKVSVLVGTIAAVLLALAFAFGDPATWKGVGQSVATGVANVLTWRP